MNAPNFRKLKLNLSVALVNLPGGQDILDTLRELMSSFQEEVGRFNGLIQTRESSLDSTYVQQDYALEFENCTLDVQTVYNVHTQSQYINGFELR